MGTNFFFCEKETGREVIHIGKRSASGFFCWDCGISLCAAGHAEVHEGNTRWLNECPICGKDTTPETLEESTAPKRKDGVRSCSSFTWAISPGHYADVVKFPNIVIQDEYGNTIDNFQSILRECPIMFWDLIGKEFS